MADRTASSTCHAVICVPLRDERRNIAGLIRAVAAQDAASLADTVLLLCFDGADPAAHLLAEQELANAPRLRGAITVIDRCDVPDAGRARRAAMEAGLTLAAPDGVLLTTDADTRPDPDWLAASLAALRSVECVCGHIRRRDASRDRWRAPMERYLDRLADLRAAIDPIAHDPAPRHWNEGGASIALTAATYRAIGGVPLLSSGEDRALVEAVRHAGLRVRHDPAVRVATSSRATGRATGGLADAIRAGRTATAEPMVEHPAAVIARFAREAAIRRAYLHGQALPTLDAAAVRAAPCAEALFGHAMAERGAPTPLAAAMRHLDAIDDRAVAA
jgi:hypothetical protein